MGLARKDQAMDILIGSLWKDNDEACECACGGKYVVVKDICKLSILSSEDVHYECA